MPTRRRSNHHAVAYTIKGLGHCVTVNTKFTAKVIYQLWIQLAREKQLKGSVTVYALMSPTSWSEWSRKHIIALMNNSWKWRMMCKTIIDNEQTKEIESNTNFTIRGDLYESNAEYTYKDLPHTVLHALHMSMLYPEVLQLLLRAPTALSAKVAMKTANYITWPDGTKIDHIDKVWEYLHLEVKRY